MFERQQQKPDPYSSNNNQTGLCEGLSLPSLSQCIDRPKPQIVPPTTILTPPYSNMAAKATTLQTTFQDSPYRSPVVPQTPIQQAVVPHTPYATGSSLHTPSQSPMMQHTPSSFMYNTPLRQPLHYQPPSDQYMQHNNMVNYSSLENQAPFCESFTKQQSYYNGAPDYTFRQPMGDQSFNTNPYYIAEMNMMHPHGYQTNPDFAPEQSLQRQGVQRKLDYSPAQTLVSAQTLAPTQTLDPLPMGPSYQFYQSNGEFH